MLHIANMPRMRGISLVSLMVAMVVGLLVSLAAVSTLSVSRISFNTVDTASQMQDNMRLARQLIQRLLTQAGFKDLHAAAQSISAKDTIGSIAPNVMGFDNANPVINSSMPAPL
jgi:type IV pilus assembly protein PilW